MTSAAERARAFAEEMRRRGVSIYQDAADLFLQALLAHEAEVREECAKIAEGIYNITALAKTASRSGRWYVDVIGKAIRDAGREKERKETK